MLKKSIDTIICRFAVDYLERTGKKNLRIAVDREVFANLCKDKCIEGSDEVTLLRLKVGEVLIEITPIEA